MKIVIISMRHFFSFTLVDTYVIIAIIIIILIIIAMIATHSCAILIPSRSTDVPKRRRCLGGAHLCDAAVGLAVR